jgi:hypothetical protein
VYADLLDHIGEIVGKSIEIVSTGGFLRATKPAAVIGDDAEAGA